MYRYKWKPNNRQKADFKEKLEIQDNRLNELIDLKPECGFRWNDNKSSLYFEYNDINYRISTHHLPNHNNDNDFNKYRNYHPLLNSKKTIEIIANSRDNILLKAKAIINEQMSKLQCKISIDKIKLVESKQTADQDYDLNNIKKQGQVI